MSQARPRRDHVSLTYISRKNFPATTATYSIIQISIQEKQLKFYNLFHIVARQEKLFGDNRTQATQNTHATVEYLISHQQILTLWVTEFSLEMASTLLPVMLVEARCNGMASIESLQVWKTNT